MEEFRWIFQFFGRLHPMIVHFPIGLLVVGFILELATIGKRRQGLRQGINWMIYIGAGSAIIGAIMGWLLRTNDDYSGGLVDLHQYMGIATGLMSGLTAFLLMRKIKNKAHKLCPVSHQSDAYRSLPYRRWIFRGRYYPWRRFSYQRTARKHS